MSNLVGLSSLRSVGHLKSITTSGSGASKTLSISSRTPSESLNSGSFANLKITAEKLVKEQASAKTDLNLANVKLKKLTEHIHVLEEKLQNAFNENAKLKVKQKEDEKLWKGLESKFSSTKTLCDQLTETLQQLAGQVQDAEKDKEYFEDKLSASSAALDNLNDQLKSLSIRLESSQETVRHREKELRELRLEKEDAERSFQNEQNRVSSLMEEKDAIVKNFEATITANGLVVESLNSKLGKLHHDLDEKEKDLQTLRESKENLVKEKENLLSINKEFAGRLENALLEIKKLEEFVNLLSVKFVELESQSLTFSEKVVQLNDLFESCFKLVQEEKLLAAQIAQQKFDKLQGQSRSVETEKNDLQLVNQELQAKIIELQKEQESTMVQHADECRIAEVTIRRLESEVETLACKKNEMELLINKLQEEIKTLSESSCSSEKKMEDLLLKISELEFNHKHQLENLQEDVAQKQDESDFLRREIEKHEEHIGSLEKQIADLSDTLDEKVKIATELEDRAKLLEEQKNEIEGFLGDAETRLTEAKKQYDNMLESKQSELSRHLKEISQRNDQAISDIRRKYETEKLESINLEKEKADKVIHDMEKQCEQKLEACKEESRQYLLRLQEENAALISRVQQEHDKKELDLISRHSEELRRIRLQAENDLNEKTVLLKNKHDEQLKAIRSEHADEIRTLQEELDIQKAKEERQRALLQLQWKVMDDNPEGDQEVNSRKNYSVSSAKLRNLENRKKSHHTLEEAEDDEKSSPYPGKTQTPVSGLLKKVEKVKTGAAITLPKHSKKVTHREYEVETSNGRTITKRRKTKSTVMFGDTRKHRQKETPKAIDSRDVVKGTMKQNYPNPSNIGDLFSEGSLNPYADDPYAFD